MNDNTHTSTLPLTAQKSQNAFEQKKLQAAFEYCRAINRAHSENFPVASLLLPKKMRPALDAIYAFSRTADDFADEPEFEQNRIPLLQQWENELNSAHPTHPIFQALLVTRNQFKIPSQLFQDLISAFIQDVTKTRYQNFAEVLDYCKRSANPVGRLWLHLSGHTDPKSLKQSDAICTALQLANFWQDVAVDLTKNRIYLPQDDLHESQISEETLFQNELTPALKKILAFQVQRTREFFLMGIDLGLNLPGRLGIEMRTIIKTGWMILDKIEAVDFDVFKNRPQLGKTDFLKAATLSLFKNSWQKSFQT